MLTFFCYEMEVLFIKNLNSKNENLVNEEIPFPKVLTIDANGDALGVLPTKEAIQKAYEAGYDLVCVAPQAKVPVCRFMDYAKYRYEQKKRAKDARKNQKTITVKEIRLSPVMDTNDLNVRIKQGKEFLAAGYKVKLNLSYRSRRMLATQGFDLTMINRYIEAVKEEAIVESEPKVDGRSAIAILRAK
ncbi:MAG TPA: translation initiation factor IF-3 [Bacilli bacterium]|jgi:translation initiation factor IF-3|nr:translation initiation factor IF-3 [Bacilli bacterium]